VALACKRPLHARLATGADFSFFLFILTTSFSQEGGPPHLGVFDKRAHAAQSQHGVGTQEARGALALRNQGEMPPESTAG
jgi:hypothetical protein